MSDSVDSEDGTPPPPEGGECWNCGTEVDDDFYCLGCGQFICGDCETGLDSPIGCHEPEDHFPHDPVELDLTTED